MSEQDYSKEQSQQGVTKAKAVPQSTDKSDRRSNGDQPTWTDKAIATFTICLVVVAVVQGYIFYKQWQEMHSGGVDTHALADAAKAQADAAIAQSNESKEQIRKMEESLAKTDTLIKEATVQALATHQLSLQAQRSADYAQQAIKASVESERPWVGVSSSGVANFVEGQTAQITLSITNSGKRPASAKVAYGVATFASLPRFPILAGSQTSVAYILPGGSFSSTFEYSIPEHAFLDWKKNSKTLFVFEEIVYTDVGTNMSYISHYCQYYDPDNKLQPFHLCTSYNEAR